MSTTAKARPILFSSALAGKVHDGSKTKTRRVVKGRVTIPDGTAHFRTANETWWQPLDHAGNELGDGYAGIACPYGVPGDRLWVREATAWDESEDGQDLIVYADGETWSVNKEKGGLCHKAKWKTNAERRRYLRWKPSIHMPRWACRTVLELTDVRVERVKDITESDAEKEGFARKCGCAVPPLVLKGVPRGGRNIECPTCYQMLYSAEYQFQKLWDELNGPRGHSWGSNPWVWVLEFKRVEAIP